MSKLESIFLSLTLIILFGCNNLYLFNKPVQQAIIAKAKGCAIDTTSNCLLNLKDVTDFEWDRLYFFSEYVDYDNISEVIGFTYRNNNGFIPDETTRLIFTYKTSVTHEEDMDWRSGSGSIVNIDLPVDTTSFSKEKDAYTKEFPYVDKTDAIYLIRRINRKNGKYFFYLVLKKNLGKKSIILVG